MASPKSHCEALKEAASTSLTQELLISSKSRVLQVPQLTTPGKRKDRRKIRLALCEGLNFLNIFIFFYF